MPNRADRRRDRKINELREQAIEALKQTPYIDIHTENDDVFRVWHPMLVDDDTQKRIEYVQAGEGLDRDDEDNIKVPHRINGELAEPFLTRLAKAVLDDEPHARFIAAGGRSQDINLAWAEMGRQIEDIEDEDPKSETP